MKDKQHIIFDKGECLSEDMLIRYANDQMTAREKHVVEKHTLGCEMCADALEGVMLMKDPSQLKGIVESLNKRINGAGEGRKPIILWMRPMLAIAAGLALFIGLFFIFNKSLNDASNNNTVSDNLKSKQEADKSISSKEEDFKQGPPTTSLEQSPAAGKGNSASETNEVDNTAGPAKKKAKGITAGDDVSQISTGTQSGLSRAEEPPPPPQAPLSEQKGRLNDITMDGRSKSADKKVPAEPIIPVEKSKVSKDDEARVPAGVAYSSESLSPAPSQLQGAGGENKSYNRKTESPKKEENERALSKAEKRKEKNAEPGITSEPGILPKAMSEAKQDVSGSSGYESAPQSAVVRQDQSAVREDSDSFGSGISEGEKKYNSKDYDQAVLLFAKTLQSQPTDRKALYLLGCSYLELDKPDLAIIQFDKLINLGAGIYYDGARYNKAIALMKQNKNDAAKILLEEIVQTSTEYKARAAKALKKMK